MTDSLTEDVPQVLILSGCRLAAAGLQAACGDISTLILQDDAPVPAVASAGMILCWMTDSLHSRLRLTETLGRLLAGTDCQRVIVFTTPPQTWLFGTLLHQVRERRKLAGLYVVDRHRCTPDAVRQMCDGDPPGRPVSGRASYPASEGLTRQEMRIVQAWLGGETMKAIRARTGLAAPTIYLHRGHGMAKLGIRNIRSA